MTKKNA